MSKKCTNCGLCCKAEVCKAGKLAFGEITPPCPALINENGIYLCEIVITEKAFFNETPISDALGIGKGCTNEEFVGLLTKQ